MVDRNRVSTVVKKRVSSTTRRKYSRQSESRSVCLSEKTIHFQSVVAHEFERADRPTRRSLTVAAVLLLHQLWVIVVSFKEEALFLNKVVPQLATEEDQAFRRLTRRKDRPGRTVKTRLDPMAVVVEDTLILLLSVARSGTDEVVMSVREMSFMCHPFQVFDQHLVLENEVEHLRMSPMYLSPRRRL
jgi:hypothetical protein